MELPPIRLTRSTIALTIKATALILTALAIYYQDLIIIVNDALQNELTSYILVIPFLLIYLMYRKRKMLRAVIPFETSYTIKKPTHINEIAGALLCLLAFLLYWHGSYTFTPLEYHMISLSFFVAGLILIIFNTKTLRVAAFLIVFLLFLTPPPLQIVSQVGAILSTAASEASYNVLRALGLPVTLATQYEAPLIILNKPESPPFTFSIETSCSGIYSLIGFTIFAVFVAYIARGTTWKKTTIFLVGFPLIYALNIFRIIIIVLIGYQYGAETATQTFHLLGGWVLIFIGTFILLFLSEKIWKIQIFTPNTKAASCPNCNPNTKNKEPFCQACGRLLHHINISISKRDLAKTATLLISALLILILQVPVFALTEGPAQVLIQSPGGEQATATQIFPQIPDYNLSFVYRDKKFEEIAPRDAALVYAYTPINEVEKTVVVSLEVGSSKKVWHSWESSVILWPQKFGLPPRAIQMDLRDVQLLQNPPIIGRFFAFQQTNSNMTQVVLYWYENAIFRLGTTSEQKYVKISLINFTSNPESIYQIEEQLLPFGLAIANYWQPIKTWSQIALILSKNGTLLMTIPTTFLAIILIVHAVQKQKKKKSNRKIYEKLASEEKVILQVVHQASHRDKPTASTIASLYQEFTGKSIELGTLREKLIEAEKVGLVKREITNQQDEPILTWKSHVSAY